MKLGRLLAALWLGGCLAACSSPLTQSAYAPAVVETPQPVSFFCGNVIAFRNATLEYGQDTGFGVTPALRFPPSAGLHFGGRGSDVGARISAGIVDFYAEASQRNVPAQEYTVQLDTGTFPPNPSLPRSTAIIVVQNQDWINAGAGWEPPIVGRALVRVVGTSARVMNGAGICSPPTPPLPGGNAPFNPPPGSALAATRPMPVPLPAPVAAGGCCAWGGRKWEPLHSPRDFSPYAYGIY